MSLHLMIGLIGLLYILVFGMMAVFRREGLSIRFAVESVCITAIAVILVVLTPIQIHPVWFLLLLYLITLRVRILVDLANVFARRGNYLQAEKIYSFASHLWPDQSSDLIIKVNHAILLLQKNQLDKSISMFTDVLADTNKGYLGVKYESAAHFNLAVAYLRNNNNSMATVEFNAVLDTWPASLYARRAQEALERLRGKSGTHIEGEPHDP
ncbi:MAG: tetratricopeptide repeat protein [Anaerolineales bacterium]|jgi:tetratricopeptide (TPR) repeat protein